MLRLRRSREASRSRNRAEPVADQVDQSTGPNRRTGRELMADETISFSATTSAGRRFDKIDCVSVSFPNQATNPVRTAGRSGPFSLIIARFLDGNSVVLHMAAVNGDGFDEATVTMEAGSTSLGGVSSIVLDMTDGNFADYNLGQRSSSGKQVEQVTLSFAKMKRNFHPVDPGQPPLAPMTTGYDLAQNTPV